MNGLKSGELAKEVGVNVETLRYYERRGLMPEPPRRESGYRIYPDSSVDRLRFIKGAQELGFTLDEIKELLALRVDENASSGSVKYRAQNKVAQIDSKIAALTQMRDALAGLIDQCDGNHPMSECPILEGIELRKFETINNGGTT